MHRFGSVLNANRFVFLSYGLFLCLKIITSNSCKINDMNQFFKCVHEAQKKNSVLLTSSVLFLLLQSTAIFIFHPLCSPLCPLYSPFIVGLYSLQYFLLFIFHIFSFCSPYAQLFSKKGVFTPFLLLQPAKILLRRQNPYFILTFFYHM